MSPKELREDSRMKFLEGIPDGILESVSVGILEEIFQRTPGGIPEEVLVEIVGTPKHIFQDYY